MIQKMHRIYFSAYQRGLGDESIAAEQESPDSATDILMREHRLYQVDFLLRKYGFNESDIVFESEGNLSLSADPKQVWADRHPEIFPVNVNAASKFDLLKVPGLGLVTVERILKQRVAGRIRGVEDIGKAGVRLKKASNYLVF